jgi:cell division protein FtsI/penicillin-binding protein 2
VELQKVTIDRIFDRFDTDGNGVVDTETITSSVVGYSPSDNPKMSIVVVSPDISTANSSYTSPVTKRISAQIVNKFFEIFK